MNPDEYVGRCKGLVISLSEELPANDIGWAMHLIDHGEPAEAIAVIGWSIETLHGSIEAEMADRLNNLIGDLVPIDSLPPAMQTCIHSGPSNEVYPCDSEE